MTAPPGPSIDPLNPAQASNAPAAPGAWTVHRLAGSLGFVMLGIAPAAPSRHEQFFLDWLASGKHGSMDYLARDIQQRLDPGKIVPGARSIICLADPCDHSKPPDISASADAQGRIARYAWKPDYHRDIKKRLHGLADALREKWPEHAFRSVVDTAPVMEREHAQRAGLGWIGKHTLLIHPQHGSWFMLGQIITTLPLQTTAEAGEKIHSDHCGQCTRCIDACPASCISPYTIDASRCVSYLTIEHRDIIPIDQHAAMGQWLAGCDICQEVCPYNHHDAAEADPGMNEGASGVSGASGGSGGFRGARSFSLLEVLGWTPEARQTALQRSALKRIKLDQFKRNAMIAAGNLLLKDPAHPQAAPLLQRINTLAADESEDAIVRQTARQVLQRLAKAEGNPKEEPSQEDRPDRF